jgi:hypothetical protein
VQSGLHLDRGCREAGKYVKVIVLAACSMAISIIIWSLRSPGILREPHLLGHNPGFVFPLYRYYQQFSNGSHVGGRGRWRGSRVGFHGRGIRSEESKLVFELHGGHRVDDRLLYCSHFNVLSFFLINISSLDVGVVSD